MIPDGPIQSVEITDVLLKPQALRAARGERWVFGYGSLMWRPDFDYRLCVAAEVRGWHRQFTLLSIKAWGTEEKPGLSAALHKGGRVRGLAFSIPSHAHDRTLSDLYRREAAYSPKEVSLKLADGATLSALTFVQNPDNGRFLSDPSLDLQARHIAQGIGPRGSSLHYLEQTVATLDQLGSNKTRAHDLLAHVRDVMKP